MAVFQIYWLKPFTMSRILLSFFNMEKSGIIRVMYPEGKAMGRSVSQEGRSPRSCSLVRGG